jgi:hypothetical protein
VGETSTGKVRIPWQRRRWCTTVVSVVALTCDQSLCCREVEGYCSSVTYAATPPTADVVARAFGCIGGRVLVGLDERLG